MPGSRRGRWRESGCRGRTRTGRRRRGRRRGRLGRVAGSARAAGPCGAREPGRDGLGKGDAPSPRRRQRHRRRDPQRRDRRVGRLQRVAFAGAPRRADPAARLRPRAGGDRRRGAGHTPELAPGAALERPALPDRGLAAGAATQDRSQRRGGAHDARRRRRSLSHHRVAARRRAAGLAAGPVRDPRRKPWQHRLLHRRHARAGAVSLRARPVGGASVSHRSPRLLPRRTARALRRLRVRRGRRRPRHAARGSGARLGRPAGLRRGRAGHDPVRRRAWHARHRRALLVHRRAGAGVLLRRAARLRRLPGAPRAPVRRRSPDPARDGIGRRAGAAPASGRRRRAAVPPDRSALGPRARSRAPAPAQYARHRLGALAAERFSDLDPRLLGGAAGRIQRSARARRAARGRRQPGDPALPSDDPAHAGQPDAGRSRASARRVHRGRLPVAGAVDRVAARAVAGSPAGALRRARGRRPRARAAAQRPLDGVGARRAQGLGRAVHADGQPAGRRAGLRRFRSARPRPAAVDAELAGRHHQAGQRWASWI